MSMWETPAPGDDTPQATQASAVRAAVGDICPTCGVRRGRARSAAARPASRRNGRRSGRRWARSGRRHRYGEGN